MIENLKIALKRQTKIIIIFSITIFLPSLALSIFGIRAIRNEKFRLAQQFEKEHDRIADLLKTNINSRLEDIATILQNLARDPVFYDRDYPAIKELLNNQLTENNPIDQIFIIYKNEPPIFPLMQTVQKNRIPVSNYQLNNAQQQKLKNAEGYEFTHKNYRRAIFLYNELFLEIKDRNMQAQLLNHMARSLIKLKKYHRAIILYSRLIDEYPQSMTSSDLLISLIAHLQKIECYQMLGDHQKALKASLLAYHKILRDPWKMNEDQFITYAAIIEETVTNILSKSQASLSEKEKYKNEFAQLKKSYENKIEQWEIINDLKKECIPELRRRLVQGKANLDRPYRQSKSIDNKDFLILAVMIPDKDTKNARGILGVRIRNNYLEKTLLQDIITNLHLDKNTVLTISNLSGRILYGRSVLSEEFSRVTSFFDDNFPPWKIEISYLGTNDIGIMAIHKSFYFWTILTLIMVLSFGIVLIVRAVSHEMEILKIKTDFVSSVSHEFKTPLASIKALTERLLDGKVKNSQRMQQYFSVISQDTNKLTRLVGNILSFSKIEEGKKEYDFEETDITQWLNNTVEDCKKERIQAGIKIRTEIADNIPHLKIDKNELSQVINNLLDNAIKFSTNKSEINVIVIRKENDLIIQVIDYGIGIPQDELNKIFEKFYQGGNANRYSVKGTGLGLTLVKHTVEAHGGKISVESKVGQGSTFSIFLPIKK